MYNEMPTPTKRGDNDNHNSELGMQFVAASGGIQVNLPDNTVRRFITSSNEPRSGNRAINLEHVIECMKDISYRPHCNEMIEICTGESDLGNASTMESNAS
ncbi:hypothetical protein ACFX1Q_030380 [Malus domestica]